jgi:putative addiction module component (TIGR02574 family)
VADALSSSRGVQSLHVARDRQARAQRVVGRLTRLQGVDSSIRATARICDGSGCAARVVRDCATDGSMAKPALDLTKLTPEEKLELIDELWTSISPEEFPLTDEQRVELHQRLDHLDEEGPTGVPWDSVRAEMTPRS